MAPVFQSSGIALSLFTVLSSVLNGQLIGSASFLKKIGGIPSGPLDFVSSVSSRIDLINRFETEKLVTNPSVTSLVCLVEILHGCEYTDWKYSVKSGTSPRVLISQLRSENPKSNENTIRDVIDSLRKLPLASTGSVFKKVQFRQLLVRVTQIQEIDLSKTYFQVLPFILLPNVYIYTVKKAKMSKYQVKKDVFDHLF